MDNFDDNAWFAGKVADIALKHNLEIDIDFDNKTLNFKGDESKAMKAFLEMEENFLNL